MDFQYLYFEKNTTIPLRKATNLNNRPMVNQEVYLSPIEQKPITKSLCEAINRNESWTVQRLLSSCVDVNKTSHKYKIPLKYATSANNCESHFDIIKMLLKHGADVNSHVNRNGETPFWYLVKKSNVETVEFYLSYNADVHAVTKNGSNLLFPAATNKSNPKVVQLLIDLGLDVNKFDKKGKTPLHMACRTYLINFKVIKCLLRNGANMNFVDKNGYTPVIEGFSRAFVQLVYITEERKKKLNFALSHTDFSDIHVDILKVDSNKEDIKKSVEQLILEHIAKLSVLNLPVNPVLFDLISAKCENNDYYEQCKEELLRAKGRKIKNSWISFFNLLVDDRKKMKNYSGNQDLIDTFMKPGWGEKFSIYRNSIFENVKKGVKRRELYDKSVVLLSDSLPIFNPTHLIIRGVVDCVLSIKDLSKFCGKNNNKRKRQ